MTYASLLQKVQEKIDDDEEINQRKTLEARLKTANVNLQKLKKPFYDTFMVVSQCFREQIDAFIKSIDPKEEVTNITKTTEKFLKTL